MITQTASSAEWRRVTRHERCPVCNHPDWCTIGVAFVCCMRVQSPRPAHNGGWLHHLAGAPAPAPIPRPKPEPPSVNCTAYLSHLISDPRLLANRIGVEPWACYALRTAWDNDRRAWAWPMKDPWGNVIGIRFRNDAGVKWTLTGSHNGLFLPLMPPQELCVICEGPTDTAAALSLGFFSIGRPMCVGLENQVNRYLQLKDVRRALIISDNDERSFKGANGRQVNQLDRGNQGYLGAVKLAAALPVPSAILMLPAKDMRAFYQQGGSAGMVMALSKSLVWNVPRGKL